MKSTSETPWNFISHLHLITSSTNLIWLPLKPFFIFSIINFHYYYVFFRGVPRSCFKVSLFQIFCIQNYTEFKQCLLKHAHMNQCILSKTLPHSSSSQKPSKHWAFLLWDHGRYFPLLYPTLSIFYSHFKLIPLVYLSYLL